MQLSFHVITAENGTRVKVRDDGRRGPCVADEAVLWDALQHWKGEHERLLDGYARVEAERNALREQLEARPGRGKK